MANLVVALAGAASGRDVPVLDAAGSAEALAQTRAPKICTVANLAKGDAGQVFRGQTAQVLPPGRYLLHAPLAAGPLGGLAVGTIKIVLRAGETTREVSAIQFPQADEFTDVALEFTVPAAQQVPIAIDWWVVENQKNKGLIGKRALEIGKALGGGAAGPTAAITDTEKGKDEETDLEDEITEVPLDEAKERPIHLLVSGIHVETLSPVAVRVRSDKIVYRPGDPGGAAVEFQNSGAGPVQLAYAVELLAGLRPAQPLKQGTVQVPAGKTVSVKLDRLFDTAPMRWGAELRVTATGQGLPPTTGRDVFAVSSNIWETAIIAAGPHSGDFRTQAQAEAHAQKLRDEGYTGFECFFWAPCDLLDFTPDEDMFFSGQTAYPGSVVRTRDLIAASHQRGLCATVYANLWGGSGPPAMEVMRAHPDWFGNANYSTFVLDDWDLLGPSQAEMGSKKIRAPGIATWCFNQLYVVPPEEAFRYHANELIKSAEIFGWDGVRYDSFYTRYWSTRAIRLIRELVAAKFPHYGFGYNSFAMSDARGLALDDLVGGGGMIMGEGIRIEGSQNLEAFANEVQTWRETIWAYGGQGPGMLFRSGTDFEEMTQLGVEYQASIILASGGHLYYDRVKGELGDYPSCALRYSEFIYNNRMRGLKDPAAVVSWKPDVALLAWPGLARTVTLDGTKRRLVLHFIPKPVEMNPFKDKAMKSPPPIRNLQVAVNLPSGATVDGCWAISAILRPNHQPLPCQIDGGTAKFTLPETRIWTAVVLDFTSDTPLATAVTLKDKTDTYIQDWLVLGPFENDVDMSATKKAYPPEEKLNLKGEYRGRDNASLKWVRSIPAGQPAVGRLPLDFRDTLNLHDGAPGCAYAVTEIQSDTEREALLMGKADETLALWINGKPVPFVGGCGEFQSIDEGQAVVHLLKGRNTVLAKVCEKWLYWLLALRLAN